MNLKRLILKPFYKIMSIPYMASLKKGVTKNDFTIISNDCCGGVIYHRIGKQFCSPFINLYLEHNDFLLMLSNLDYYLNEELKELTTNANYPIGFLGDANPVKIHFLHYKNFEDAKLCWCRRKERIIKDRTIVIFNLTNSLDVDYVENCIGRLKKCNIENWIVLSRFDSSDPNVIKIDFSDLNVFSNAQILSPQIKPYKLHIDQIGYAKVFSRFKN